MLYGLWHFTHERCASRTRHSFSARLSLCYQRFPTCSITVHTRTDYTRILLFCFCTNYTFVIEYSMFVNYLTDIRETAADSLAPLLHASRSPTLGAGGLQTVWSQIRTALYRAMQAEIEAEMLAQQFTALAEVQTLQTWFCSVYYIYTEISDVARLRHLSTLLYIYIYIYILVYRYIYIYITYFIFI